MTLPATLPQSLTIDNVVYVQHWRTHNHIVFQSYTEPAPTSNDPLANPLPQIVGINQFHVYQIMHDPGESLGAKLATFTDLLAAISFVEKQEQLA